MSINDPMLDYTVEKLKAGIKALQKLEKYSDYINYAPDIAASIESDIKTYCGYIEKLKGLTE